MEYLPDNLIEKSAFDQFGHQEIAKELAKIIKSGDCQNTSFTVGIFGKWGVGKSSIISLLRSEELKEEDNNLVFIDIPIWKYSDPKSIRRKFIYQIAKKLKQEDEIKKIYYDITTEGSLNFVKKLKELLKELKNNSESLLNYILIFFIAAIIIYAVFKEINLNNFLLFYNSALTIALVGFIIKLIQDIKFSRISETQKVFEGEEQFEHLVEKCLITSSEKKVFIIDDLDRCDSSRILSVFEVIKNFINIKNCVFIIACDPDVIRKAIDLETKQISSEAVSESETKYIHSKNSGFYIEKIFQYIIDIPENTPQNLRDYAKKIILSADLELFKDPKLKIKLDRIIYTLIYQDTFNPRKVKTLINKFILNYNVALKLENNPKSFLTRGLITNYPDRLAFISVVRSDFPHLIGKLKEAPSHNFLQWALGLQNESGFQEYLTQNEALFENDWSLLPFLNFNIDPSITSLHSSQLENVTTLSSSLRNGNYDVIQKYVTNESEARDFIQYSYNQIEILNNSIELNNATKIFLILFSKVDFRSIEIEKNDIAENKLLHYINDAMRNLTIDRDGLISFIGFLFVQRNSKGIQLFSNYLATNIKTNVDKLDIVFNERYFEIYNTNVSNLIMNTLSPTNENISNIILLINKVTFNYSKYQYFRQSFLLITSIYEKVHLGEKTVLDKNLLESTYFIILKACLEYNASDFPKLLQPSTRFDDFINAFEKDILNYNEIAQTSITNGLINICTTNDIPIIKEEILEFIDKLIQNSKVPSNFETTLDQSISNEIKTRSLYFFDIESVRSLLVFISNNIEKLDLKFEHSRSIIQESIDFEEDVAISREVLEWIKRYYYTDFNPLEVIKRSLRYLFSNPSHLREPSNNHELITLYFEYLNFYLNQSFKKKIIIGQFEYDLTAQGSTLYPTNCARYSNDFVENLFKLMVVLQLKANIDFQSVYSFILSNYTSYSDEVINYTISNILEVIDSDYKTIPGDSSEVILYNKIINDSKLSPIVKFEVFVYRFLITNTWWPETDIRNINLINQFYQTLPSKIKTDFLKTSEIRLNGILSPKKWAKDTSWEKLAKRVCNCFINISKIHKIGHAQLLNSINDAMEFYVNKNGYVETIIALLKLLNAECIPSDSMPNKSRFAKNLRLAITKYKKIRKGIGIVSNIKFNLNIGKSYFK